MTETVEEGLDFGGLALPILESAVAERSTKSRYKWVESDRQREWMKKWMKKDTTDLKIALATDV